MTDPIRLPVLSAGLSPPSPTRMLADQLSGAARRPRGAAGILAARLSAAPRRQLHASGASVEARPAGRRAYAPALTDAMPTRFAGARLSLVVESLRVADAVTAVPPVFNVAPSGLFKSFF